MPVLPHAWIAAMVKPDHGNAGGSVGNGQLPAVPAAAPVRFSNGNGTPYGLRARQQELNKVRTAWEDDNGNFNNQVNRGAFALGQLVAGGELDAYDTFAELQSLLAELGAPADQYKSLRSGWASGLADPRDRVTSSVPGGNGSGNGNGQSGSVQPSRVASADDVLIIDGLRGDRHKLEYGKYTEGEDGETTVSWHHWANFDVRATGKTIDPEGVILEYQVEVHRMRDGAVIETQLSTKTLSAAPLLAKWLAGNEIAVVHHQMRGAWYSRLSNYLAGQRAPIARTARHLGWDDESESFLTHEGVLSADGMSQFNGTRPDPILRRQAILYVYGFEHDLATAQSVLREVLTFHDEGVTSVFGAWWAACWLKAQIIRKTSMFPVMAIRAPSESGKTNGFFPMMVALQGNQRGQANDTAANFRDIVAGHRSGIAWQDDLDDPGRLFELLRAATSEGTIGKKGEDRTASVDAKLVAPVMISGESLNMDHQKALIDRTVMLEVGSPKGRRSLHDPTRPQWDDIVSLREQYPDLTAFAGHLGALALRQVSLVDRVAQLRGDQSGRHADKLAVVRLGARVLAMMTDDATHIERVDDWASRQQDLGSENTLTLALIPEYLRMIGSKDVPRRYDSAPHHAVPYPVLIRPDRTGDRAVWVNTDLLAQWWKEHRRGKVDDRTETAGALAGQAREMGMLGTRAGESGLHWLRLRVHDGDNPSPNRNEKYTWQRVPAGEAADRILEAFDESDADLSNVTPIDGASRHELAARVHQARRRQGQL